METQTSQVAKGEYVCVCVRFFSQIEPLLSLQMHGYTGDLFPIKA